VRVLVQRSLVVEAVVGAGAFVCWQQREGHRVTQTWILLKIITGSVQTFGRDTPRDP
jgi:hypothetical protein